MKNSTLVVATIALLCISLNGYSTTDSPKPATGNQQPVTAAQPGKHTIKGKVTNAKGEPIAEATVIAKRSGKTVVTNPDGSFTMEVNNNETALTISYVGMEDKEIDISNKTSVAVNLVATNAQLDDVVVIGYGTVKKRDLTGSVASVKASDIVRSPTSNPLEAIQGMVPGADITRSSGKAGAGVTVLIRGTRTINGSSDPLYIIDGIQGGSPSTINPNDIESIEVLKDASSTAIYGSQGANGVIIITTKKGASGRTKVSYNAYYGVDGWAEYPTPLMGTDYINLRRQAYSNPASGTPVWASPADDSKIFSTAEMAAINANQWVNWVKLVSQNGTRQNQSLSVSGGSDKTKAYLSAGFYKQTGLLKNNDMTQYNTLMNIEHTINPWIKAGMQGSFIYSNINTRKTDPYSLAMTASPFGVPYDSLGHINVYPIVGQAGAMSPLSDDRGPQIATNNTTQMRTAFNAHVDIEPIKGLTFRSVFGANLSSYRTGVYLDSSSLEEVSGKLNTASVTNENITFYNWDNIITWHKKTGDHDFTITALTSYTNSKDEQYSITGTGITYSSQLFYSLQGSTATNRVIASSYIGKANMSYAGRINYSYKGKYLVTVTERTDGASILSVGRKWASFPSVALGWRLSDENFMQHVRSVENLKLRLSYGVAGNSGIPAYGTQSLLTSQAMGFGNVPAPAYIFSNIIGNTDVTWELSKTANLGVDASFFHNRLTVSVDAYNVNTSRILLLRSLPPDLGVASTYQNVGTSNNKGIELSLNSRNIDKRNFKWLSTFSFMTNRQKITGLISGTDIIDGTNPETASLLIGHPIHSFYNYKKLGIWQTSEQATAALYKFGTTPFKPGDIKLADLTNDSIISPANDRTFIGQVEPKWSAGFQNTFIYKGIDLTIYVIARWGQMIYDQDLGRYNPAGQGNNGPDYFNYWTPTNPSNDFPRPKQNASISAYPGYTTLNYVDGSYFKVKTISLGYTFPKMGKEKAVFDNLRVYATCNNILVIAKSHLIKYYDPERGGAEDAPLTRQLVFGISANF
ncbi:hypothetical protein F5148DRAFT_1289077 [Russula earlei]|uniref:Uncharacterized protein n=1 Tax=Russula earlei TaxID=71964 RepID=A0ACC0TZW9_9AGAM|nr:hypothetical protein F5148DRAFT_1289077 [Russula earlei]